MKYFILPLLSGFLLLTVVWAEHEPDHRYIIRGYVLDSNQHGIDNLTVQASSEGSTLGAAQTDADGYYALHLHLHNKDYNRLLTLKAGTHEVETRVKFDVGDNTSDRVHEANFVDGKFVEGRLRRFRIPTWSYAVIGLLLIFMIAILLEKRRKKKIRLAKYGTTGKSSASGRQTNKPHRKKH